MSGQVTKFRAIFISDTHLGMRDCQIYKLLRFLQGTDADSYYFVGDIFDGHVLSSSWYWPKEYNDFIQLLLEKAKKRKVVYIPGNHDDFMRIYDGQSFGGIEIKEWCIHESLAGYRYFITHGDQFDVVIKHAKWLVFIGDHLYYILLRLNKIVNWFRRILHLPYWSFSLWAKQQTKAAISFVSSFEDFIAAEAVFYECQAVICGHIHSPIMKPLKGITYMNCGDWVENCTALVERLDGSFTIMGA